MLSFSQQSEWTAILEIARDLASSLRGDNRYARLLAAICRVIPCDAACLLRLEGDRLVPLAARGLSRAALHQTYHREEHPRLDQILSSPEGVRFAPDSPLPDPFDGLVLGDPNALEHVHDCMGIALVDDGEIVGALTLDAFAKGSFDPVDRNLLHTLGALAGATLRTNSLLEALEWKVESGRRAAVEVGRSQQVPIVGSSPGLRRVLHDIDIVARSDLAILILGETGVGKDLFAREIHQRSSRSQEPLIQVNCAALPESLAESELFGHTAGAFTGAQHDRAGKFEIAHGGTLFLDEIGELPLVLQPKLLRALQDGEIQRVGSDRPRKVQVRIIAATNRNLEQEVANGRFRADLFHRLSAFPLLIPPLRERSEDIAPLVEHFLEQNRRRLGTGRIELTRAALRELIAADWRGNVRELENVIGRAVLRALHALPPGHAVTLDRQHLQGGELRPSPSAPSDPTPPEALSLRERVDEFQKREILRALEEQGGSWSKAAKQLGMHRSNLFHMASRLGLREE